RRRRRPRTGQSRRPLLAGGHSRGRPRRHRPHLHARRRRRHPRRAVLAVVAVRRRQSRHAARARRPCRPVAAPRGSGLTRGLTRDPTGGEMAAPLRSTIPLQVTDGVYAPQEDTWLLSGVLGASGLAEGRRVLDICTGSGVLALEAAGLGAREVLAFDLCPAAVECASGNASASGLPVEVRLGTLQDAARHGPFDLVVANPPYV